MITLTNQEARTGDALKAKGQIIGTIQGWKAAIDGNDWLLDEWDDEFAAFVKQITEQVPAAPAAATNIVQP